MSDDLREARLAELLCDQALLGLAVQERSELEALQDLFETGDDPSLETAAATLHRAFVESEGLEEMPAELGRDLTDQFRQEMLIAGPRRVAPARVLVLPVVDDAAVQRPANDKKMSRGEASPARHTAWPLAAVACLAFVLGGLTGLNSPRPRAQRLEATGVAASVQVPRPDLAVQRQALIEDAGDVVRIEWKATDDSAATGAGGDVVWSPSKQRGFMRFKGLKRNDANEARYQLWIFDQKRDDRYPVDGGLFDIDSETGDMIIPIEAKLPVLDPSLFAVTVEHPKGVVVSNRERIVLTAAVDG